MRPLRLLPLLLAAACAVAPRGSEPDHAAEWLRVLAAEDARAATADDVELLRASLRSNHPEIRAVAVRALGRTERPEFADDIALLLRDPAVEVRIEAAHAFASVLRRDSANIRARETLTGALQNGVEAPAAAAIAESLGRLRHDAAGASSVAARVALLLARPDAARLGALRGMYFLARQPAGRQPVAQHAAMLEELVTRAGSARERGLAVATLAAAGAATHGTVTSAVRDSIWTVRREGVLAAAAMQNDSARALVERALQDPAAQVRHEAVRAWLRGAAAARGCAALVPLVRDGNTHVALLATATMAAEPCRAQAPVALLDSIARDRAETSWHRAAAATVALASMGAPDARRHVEQLAAHQSFFARAHAARAAGALRDQPLLRRLAADPHPNVRTAAVTALHAVAGRAADSVYAAQLSSDDSELLQAAARALEGTAQRGVAERLLDALERITRQRAETSRDARIALLERLAAVGSPADAQRLREYDEDFDPVVAERAAQILTRWTGTTVVARARPLERLALPSWTELQRIDGSTYVLEMQSGAEIRIRLLPFTAPTNAFRFARLARDGYFDGLTIHRVVPNFVVQGGSPGANEYTGDGPFTRDELGASNWRGTVGLSTRGRDTGDAQFYINLIDNVRLDHEYTIFGFVSGGMQHVDALLEGAVIRRVREERAPAGQLRPGQSVVRPM